LSPLRLQTKVFAHETRSARRRAHLDRSKAPTSPVTRAGNMMFVAGLPPFDPDTGEIASAPVERQSEIIMEQMKLWLEAAGASLDNVMKCNVYCTSTKHFAVSTRSTRAISPTIRRRGSSSAHPNGSPRSMSRSIASQ
jgi:enamine deaminase RidA (YjgF/YER057c/UK114 family)